MKSKIIDSDFLELARIMRRAHLLLLANNKKNFILKPVTEKEDGTVVEAIQFLGDLL